MKPGDIAYVYFPFSRHEREPYKRRPVLILSHVGLDADEAVGCVMITSNETRFASRGAGDVRIDNYRECNLPKKSTIRARRIWTATYRDFAGPPFGKVPSELLEETRREVRNTLQLGEAD